MLRPALSTPHDESGARALGVRGVAPTELTRPDPRVLLTLTLRLDALTRLVDHGDAVHQLERRHDDSLVGSGVNGGLLSVYGNGH